MRAYIGSYTIPSAWTGTPNGHGDGIVAVRLEGAEIERDFTAAAETNPSFVVTEPEAARLWAITEPEFGGELLCFDIDSEAGLSLVEGGRVVTGSDAPCHLALGPEYVLVSHYHGAAVAVIGRSANSRNGSSCGEHSHGEAGGPSALLETLLLPERGEGWDRSAEQSRPHCALVLPDGELFLVTDCGRDTVSLYRWNGSARGVSHLDTVPLPEGSGPRHLASIPGSGGGSSGDAGGRGVAGIVLVSLQNSGGVAALRILESWADPHDQHRADQHSSADPLLDLRQLIHTAGLDRGRAVPSEIAVHPSGEFAVLANRLDDSLSVFDIDLAGGDVRLAERRSVASEGANPRHFAFTPDGSRLVVAHQDSDELTVFRTAGGELRCEGSTPHATPTSLAFW